MAWLASVACLLALPDRFDGATPSRSALRTPVPFPTASSATQLQRLAMRLRGGAAPLSSAASTEEPPSTADRHARELTIEAAMADQDASIAMVHPNKMKELNFLDGDILRLKGKRDRETLCIVMASRR
jgi:hypothetical protein